MIHVMNSKCKRVRLAFFFVTRRHFDFFSCETEISEYCFKASSRCSGSNWCSDVIYRKKLNKSVLWAGLWDFLSFSYNRDCRTVLWKNRDWEAHNWPDCKPRENSVKILPIGIEGPYTTPVLIGFSCHAVACITFLFVLFFLIFVLLTVSMLHFSEGRPSRSDLSILVAHNDDPTGNQDLQYYNPPHLKSKM